MEELQNLAEAVWLKTMRQLLECGCPLPLSNRSRHSAMEELQNLAEAVWLKTRRQLLECGCPLPLSNRSRHSVLEEMTNGRHRYSSKSAADAAGTAAHSLGGEQSQLWLDFQSDCLALRGQSTDLVVGSLYPEFSRVMHAGVDARLPDFDWRRRVGEYAPGHVGLGHC